MTNKRKRKVARQRHLFVIEMRGLDNVVRQVRVRAEVKPAKEQVDITLSENPVLRSIELHGVGDTRTCSMACCVDENKDRFPHGYEGLVEWTYSRAYIVDTLGNDGLPATCVAYEHHNRWIAQLNDTEDGQKKLLKYLQKKGPMTITLQPYRIRSEVGRPGAGRLTTGERLGRKIGLQLRKAVSLGGKAPPGARGGPFGRSDTKKKPKPPSEPPAAA